MEIQGYDAWKAAAPEPHGMCHECRLSEARYELRSVLARYLDPGRMYSEKLLPSGRRLVLTDEWQEFVEQFADAVEAQLQRDGVDCPCHEHADVPDHDDIDD